MTTHLQNLLNELTGLNLPANEYVIVSSGVLAAKGIRECGDLDLLINKKLFDELSQKYEVIETPTIFKIALTENIEALYKEYDPVDLYPTERQIAEAEIIDGFRFNNLETCLYFKENSDREKDKADVILIKEFLAKQKLPITEPVFVPKPGQIDFTNIRRAPVINCLVEYNGKVLIVQRNEGMRFYPGYWNGVSGFLDIEGQTVAEKVYEELREELGIPESAVVSIHEGKVLEQESKDYDKVWIVHPVKVIVNIDRVTIDWEAQKFEWVAPSDIKNYKTLPGFLGVVKELYNI